MSPDDLLMTFKKVEYIENFCLLNANGILVSDVIRGLLSRKVIKLCSAHSCNTYFLQSSFSFTIDYGLLLYWVLKGILHFLIFNHHLFFLSSFSIFTFISFHFSLFLPDCYCTVSLAWLLRLRKNVTDQYILKPDITHMSPLSEITVI